MKKTIKALWHGIKAVVTAVVDWVATLFGMKEENQNENEKENQDQNENEKSGEETKNPTTEKDYSKYHREMRLVVSTLFTVVVVLFTIVFVVRIFEWGYWKVERIIDKFDSDDEVFFSEQLSEDIAYYESYYYNKGYLKNGKGRKVLKHICWIQTPMKGDSLVCFSDGEHRGYFHASDGRLVIKPVYDHAWIFSEGLAAVEMNGKIKFINTVGDVVIDKNLAYNNSVDGYVFHDGHCAVHDSTGELMGLIDHNGNWVIEPQYESIYPIDTFWIVTKYDDQAILSFGMDTVMPMMKATFEIDDDAIFATLDDHTLSVYSLTGELVMGSQVNEVEQMMYETREVMYPTEKSYDEYSGEYSFSNPDKRMAVATCLRYEAESGWYGLMSPDGHMLTPPSYVSIQAVDKDLYLCETSYDRGILLNSKGERVR